MRILNILEQHLKTTNKLAYQDICVHDIIKKHKLIIRHILFFQLKYLILQSVLEINKIFK
jgi:hypothetical protein